MSIGQKSNTEENELKADKQSETPDDAQWDADEAVLNSIIEWGHPLMAKPELYDVIDPIYNRWKGDEAKVAVVNKAIDAWAAYALKISEHLVADN